MRERLPGCQAIYAHLGYRITGRRTEDGYRRIFMEKILPARGRPGRP